MQQIIKLFTSFVLSILPTISMALPDFETVQAQWKSADVVILDRHAQPLQRVRVDAQARRVDWLSLDEVSPILRQALILAEDKRFYEHRGVDWSAVAAAIWGNLWNVKVRGASTLTMQLTSLLDDDLRGREGRRSIWQKMRQAWAAVWLEQDWSKAQILEAYLNMVHLRSEQVGLAVTSSALFNKSPLGLNAEEAAVIVALIRAPNAQAPKIAQRACAILREIDANNIGFNSKIEERCARLSLQLPLILTRKTHFESPLVRSLAPHFARKLLQRQVIPAGTVVISTIDGNLQRFASHTLQRHLLALTSRNVQDGAVLVLDNRSGEILAWVGSSGAKLSAAAQVDGVTALRQAGSTLKPFLYQLALQERWLTAASLVDDSPLELQTNVGAYIPQNYSKDFKGMVSVRTALASSLNIPAVTTIEIVTPERLRTRLVDLGIGSLLQDGEYYGSSLALGSADVQLFELANAYRTLANGGLYSEPRWTVDERPSVIIRKLDEASSFIINDILSDRVARARTFGLESVLATPYWSAVKTGTSKDMRDNWTIGFSQRYTVAVWVGNANGEPMWDVSGMHGAAPVWEAVLSYLQKDNAMSASFPSPPQGVAQRTVRYAEGVEAQRREWFLPGTERSYIAAKSSQISSTDHSPAIVMPLDGAIYALDPDIPPANQKILFRSQGAPNSHWWLDGKYLGNSEKISWFPWPGIHRLELCDANKKVIASVQFSVRGAVVRQP